MKRENWVWMPHPGHFCGSNKCRFFLSTYVGGYLVSTVGEHVTDSSKEFEEIGLNRTYETMVFKATRSGNNCCPWKMQNSSELDIEGYTTPEDATVGHYKLCRKWSKK